MTYTSKGKWLFFLLAGLAAIGLFLSSFGTLAAADRVVLRKMEK